MRLLKIVLAAAFVAAIAAGALLAADAPAKKEDALANLPSVSVMAVSTGAISDVVFASGLVSHVEQVSVQPQIEGHAIEQINVEVGATVKAGDVLARLSDTALQLKKSQLEASRAAAEAGIAQAEAQQLEAQSAADEAVRASGRAETLSARGLTARAGAEQAASSAQAAQARVTASKQAKRAAEAQRNVVDAQLADIDLQLARTGIKAPVGGVIVERNATVGSIGSAAGQPMFVILRDGLLELKADVAEQDILRLAKDQTARIRVAGSTRLITGRITLVEPVVNATSRLGRVRIAIDHPELVRWGMFADAEILVTARHALIVPVSAVGTGISGTTALKVVDGVVNEVGVVTGIREKDKIEIVSGLAEGDRIIARAGAFVRNGDRINPVVLDPAASN